MTMAGSRRIVVFGAGGHGKVVAEIATLLGFEVAAFVDDARAEVAGAHFGCPVISFDRLSAERASWAGSAALGVGNNEARRACAERLLAIGFELPALVHPRATVSASARVEPGVVVVAGATVNADATVGEGAIVNTNAVVEHDCVVAPFAHVGPGAVMCGGSRLGQSAILGARAVLRVNGAVGANATIGAGSVE